MVVKVFSDKKIYYLFLFFICSSSSLFAQLSVNGTILDKITGKPISGVEIFINDHATASLTTTNQFFKIPSDSIIYKLRFQKDKFKIVTLNIDKNTSTNLLVKLETETIEAIQDIVIQGKALKFKNKKENPAYAIMQEVWKRKRKSGLDNYKSYTFDEYEKIEFDLNNIDSAFMKRKLFNKVGFIFKYADSTENGKLALPMFLNESTYKNYGENEPTKKKAREILAQKTSGFKDNQILALTAKNLYKEVNIYDNVLNYFNIGFPSPISTEGFSFYDYNLVDERTINGVLCYHLKYFPKREDIMAFRGDFFISKAQYAVVKVDLHSPKSLNVNFINSISTDLEYDNPDENTFLPSKNETSFELSLISKGKNAKGMIAKRSVNYTNYTLNPTIDPAVFDRKEEPTIAQITKDETFWENARVDSLNTSEKGVYEMLDALQKVPKFNTMVKLYETLSSGYYNIGHAIDIGDLYSTYGSNEVEGDRLRFGARTYFSANDMWRVQGYGAYGFKDHQFKYGAEAKYMFNKNNRFTIGVGTRRDILQLGVQLTNDDGILTRSFASSSLFSRGTNASLSNINKTNIFTSIDPWKNFQIRLDGTLQSIKSANPESFNLQYYRRNILRQTVNDSHVTLSLLSTLGAKFSQTGVDRYSHTTLAPSFALKYTRGIQGLFNSDFGYNKIQFLYTQPLLLGTLGKTIINLEAGKNFDTVPLALQNIIPGNQSYSLVSNTFAQLNYYEFVTDAYATMNVEHHFNGKILSYIPLIKKLKLREIGLFRAGYGTLSDASKNINVDGAKYTAPDQQVYYEYGFGIENIGFGNLRIFRIDFNWRGNYLDRPDVSKFGIKAGFQVSF